MDTHTHTHPWILRHKSGLFYIHQLSSLRSCISSWVVTPFWKWLVKHTQILLTYDFVTLFDQPQVRVQDYSHSQISHSHLTLSPTLTLLSRKQIVKGSLQLAEVLAVFVKVGVYLFSYYLLNTCLQVQSLDIFK